MAVILPETPHIVHARPHPDPYSEEAIDQIRSEIAQARGGVLLFEDVTSFGRRVLAHFSAWMMSVSDVQWVATLAAPDEDLPEGPQRSVWMADVIRHALPKPFVERIDLTIEVSPPSEARPASGWGLAEIRQRVTAARSIRASRAAYVSAAELIQTQAGASQEDVGDFYEEGSALPSWLVPDAGGQDLMRRASARSRLTPRASRRTLLVARTIADLSGVSPLERIHVAEALLYRGLDKLVADDIAIGGRVR